MKPRPLIPAAARATALGAWLTAGVATVAIVYPVVRPPTRQRLKRGWSRGLLRILDIEVEQTAQPAPGALLAANHLSWVDIFAINAVCPTGFVAKSEVRRWPVIGWLCARTDTVFIRRQSAQHAREVNAQLRERLARGVATAIFPEGTSSEGEQVLPFSTALFQPAVDARVAVQPAAIRYRRARQRSTAPCYTGEITLGQSIWAILRTPGLSVSIDWLPPVEVAGRDRRELAGEAERRIRSVITMQ